MTRARTIVGYSVATEALLGKARIAIQNQDTAGAYQLVNRVLSMEPDSVDAWTLNGELLRAAGKPQEAAAAFEKAVEIAPNDASALFGKATTLISLGETDRALVDIERLLERYPNLFLVHYLKALALYQQQQLVHDAIVQWLREEAGLPINQIDYDASLFELGIDSMGVAEIATDIESLTGKRLQAEEVFELETINELAPDFVIHCGDFTGLCDMENWDAGCR